MKPYAYMDLVKSRVCDAERAGTEPSKRLRRKEEMDAIGSGK